MELRGERHRGRRGEVGVMGDAAETIASGPISPDPVTAAQAERTLLRLFPDAPEPLVRRAACTCGGVVFV